MSRHTRKTYLKCEECGNQTSIIRRLGRQRKDGHIKHLWCYKCKDETAHEECNAGDFRLLNHETEEIPWALRV